MFYVFLIVSDGWPGKINVSEFPAIEKLHSIPMTAIILRITIPAGRYYW